MINNERLTRIFEKTHGCCHLCHRRLAYGNYGIHGAKASWQVEHSTPRAKGGTDNLNNLFAACIPCNQEKGILHTRTIRNRNGVTRAPYSKAKKERIKQDNMVGFGALGVLVGAGLAGPVGAIIGGLFGSEVGKSISKNR